MPSSNVALSNPLRIALIDNYDSYTHNLAHLIAAVNVNVPPTVISSDAFQSLHHLSRHFPPFDAFVLSPGPGNPIKESDFPPLQRHILSSHFPVFAVCLGHQALCHLHGATIQQLSSLPAHGIISTITLTPAAKRCPLFHGMPASFSAVRYHSLVAVPPSSQSFHLTPTAWTKHSPTDVFNNTPILMAVSHPTAPHFGVQFHPESVSSQYGSLLASNFIQLAARLRTARTPTPSPTNFTTHSSPTPQSPHQKFTTLYSVVRHHRNIPPYHVFSKLFANRRGAFWLDSANGDTNAARRSSCKSPASIVETQSAHRPQPVNEISTHAHQANSHFSIMGACMGPLSELVTYDVNERTVRIESERTGNVTRLNMSIFDYLQQQLLCRRANLPPLLPCEMNGGYVGYIGYEVKRDTHGVKHNRHTSHLPDAWLVFADRVVVFDHVEGSIYLVAHVETEENWQRKDALKWFNDMTHNLSAVEESIGTSHNTEQQRTEEEGSKEEFSHERRKPITFVPERSRLQYHRDIHECLRAIRAGESYEVCLTNRIRACLDNGRKMNALQFYRLLRMMNSAPYCAFLQISEEDAVCCTSPERFLKITSGGRVYSKPIKGTRRRGKSYEEDEELRRELQESCKDRSENLMIVDLVRNDLSRSCTIGSVNVPKLMHVESYATVHQLVSDVTGTLRLDCDAMECVRNAYPMGSMTGAPKIRTMEIIDGLEGSARGVYSGTVGFLSVCGAVELNVVIRTAVVEGGRVTIGVGGAVVAMSEAEEEYAEMMLKGEAIMRAVAKHVTGDGDAFVVESSDSC